MPENFIIQNHVKLLKRLLDVYPSAYVSLENNRLTMLFFVLSSLDILNRLDQISDERRTKIIEWIYRLQLTSSSGCRPEVCGFRGSFSASSSTDSVHCQYESAHLAQTYSALCCLLILGDDLARVDRVAILNAVKLCQLEDGSFAGAGIDSENDMRFVFCAISICYILNDFSFINVEKMCEFVKRSYGYDGGIAQGPCLESHGGSTYCAIASLALLGKLYDDKILTLKQLERIKKWALKKQDEGFHGRTNKPDDSCYAFWIGGTLAMLNAQSLVDEEKLRSFLMSTQDERIGGFAKYSDSCSDVLHTYFSIAALSIFHEPLLMPVFAPLNISQRAHEFLMKLKARSSI